MELVCVYLVRRGWRRAAAPDPAASQLSVAACRLPASSCRCVSVFVSVCMRLLLLVSQMHLITGVPPTSSSTAVVLPQRCSGVYSGRFDSIRFYPPKKTSLRCIRLCMRLCMRLINICPAAATSKQQHHNVHCCI